MSRLKKTLPLLLALVLILNCIPFSAAQMDDDDDEDYKEKETVVQATTKTPVDIWKVKVCTISNAKASSYQVYMKSMWKGFRVAYSRKTKKSSKWILTPVQVAGKTYFEIYNELRKTYMGASTRTASGNNQNHEKSDSTKTLFTIDPPSQNVPVDIKSFKGKFMNEPTSFKKTSVAMETKKKTQWVIKCT